MTVVRNPFVAGQFYSDNPFRLQQEVLSYINNATVGNLPAPKAIISPHAGYMYSGPIAGSAYRTVADHKQRYKRVVLLGPAHRCGFQGLATTNVDLWHTPIGDITIDKAGVAQALLADGVNILEEAFYMEHSLEVQLPFLISSLDSFTLVPIVVGEAKPEVIAGVLETLWGGDETLIVISSDLSHYNDYHTAKSMDLKTSEAIEKLNPDAIDYHDACGRKPILGLLHMAKQHGLQAKILDLRNSGDTAGSKDKVVGYGAYYFA